MGLLHGLGKIAGGILGAPFGKGPLGDIATFGLGGLLGHELLGGKKKSPVVDPAAAAAKPRGPVLPEGPGPAPGSPMRDFPVRPIGVGPGGLSDQPVMMPPPAPRPGGQGGQSVFLGGLSPNPEDLNLGRVPGMRRYPEY